MLQRVLAVLSDRSPTEQRELDGELARALELAGEATAHLETLDRRWSSPGFDSSGAEARQLLHERDTWSARLLELTATLDVLSVRESAAKRLQDARDGRSLDDLRARVEALEEIREI